MLVYSIIGPCGAGKSSLLGQLPGSIRTHKEGYIQKDNATIMIDNRTYLSKLRYISAWYLEMIKLKGERNNKIVSDRCPYDVCAYVAGQKKQHEMITEYMRELDIFFGVKVRTIYIRVSFAVAKRRVAERLIGQPWRLRYHENDENFLRKTWSYYENHISEWDNIVENEGLFEESLTQLIKTVSAR